MTTKELIAALTGASVLVILFVIIFAIALITLEIIGKWKLFKKANKPGWASIIPFYNSYVLTEIAGLNWWFFLLLIANTLVSILGIEKGGVTLIASGAIIIGNLCVFYNLGKKMHKDPITTGVLGIFFSYIMILILGFSSEYQYDENVEVSPNGIFGDNKNKTTNEPKKYCLGCGQELKPNTSFCENCGKKVE